MTKADLKALVHAPGVSRKEQLLLLLADGTPKTVKQLKDLASSVGIRWLLRANVSDRLSRTDGLAVRSTEGWELSPPGRETLVSRFPTIAGTRVTHAATDLRKHLQSISDLQTRAFLEEAVACCEQQLWRAAVVLSWCGAVSVLHAHVAQHHLTAFNTEALRRDQKWRQAKTADDLGRMKEHDFFDVLAAISILGKNVKQELQDVCLSLRNACGHPNSFALSEARVAAHLEILFLNVFQRF